MTGFRRCRRRWWRRNSARTTFGLLGFLVFLVGARLLAQSLLGIPEAGNETKPGIEAKPPEVILGAPMTVLPEETKPAIKAAQAQQKPRPILPPGLKQNPSSDEEREPFPSNIQLEVPGSQLLFRLESEAALRERMRQETLQRQKGKKLYFPEMITIMPPIYAPQTRRWGPMEETVEPCYLGFRRLYFHQINFERYGWDVGFFTPVVSAGAFYLDFLTMPLQFLAEPGRRWEYNSGWYLPGDPVPFLLYPPHSK